MIMEKGHSIILDFGLRISLNRKYFSKEIRPRNLEDLIEFGILPDIPSLYLNSKNTFSEPPLAILFSHPHIDHLCHIEYLNPGIPLFLSRKALKFLELTDRKRAKELKKKKYVELEKGPFFFENFEVTAIPVKHSVPGSYSFYVRTSDESILYTGDLFLENLENPFSSFKNEVDILIIEGTKIGEEGEKASLLERTYQLASEKDSLFAVVISEKSSVFIEKVIEALEPTLKNIGITKKLLSLAKISSGRKSFNNLKIIEEKDGVSKKELHKFYGDWAIIIEPNDMMILADINAPRGGNLLFLREPNFFFPSNQVFNLSTFLGFHLREVILPSHISQDEIAYLVEEIAPKIIIPVHTKFPFRFKEKFKNTFVPPYGKTFSPSLRKILLTSAAS